jgi:hypothetical protein
MTAMPFKKITKASKITLLHSRWNILERTAVVNIFGTAEQLPGGGAALFQAVKFPKKGVKSGKNCLIYSRVVPFP